VLFWAYITGALVARMAGVPIVVASRRSLGLFKAGKWHYLLVERLINRTTDLFIANSEAVRQDVIAQEGVPPNRIIVIYNGLDTERYAGHPDRSLRSELELGNRPVVVVVSNFIQYKGHLFFFEAWRAVIRRYTEAIALLVGEGPTRSDWEERARIEGWAASVRFLGARRDVPRILAAADLYVHPSLQEGYSNAVLEAMASSLPIVATAVGGNVEAIQDLKTGLLVPAGDAGTLAEAMNRLLGEPAFARQLARAARKAVEERHQLSGMVHAYEAVYERLATTLAGTKDSHVWDSGAV
jgi:glycosyltransferase involved in cell wall biosynthesis